MQDAAPEPEMKAENAGISWRLKLVVLLLVIFGAVVVLVTNRWLSERFTEVTRNRAELRLALYSGNMISELQRTSVVPLLLARDPELIGALTRKEYSATSARLISFQSEIGAASIILLDAEGRIVGATNRNQLGANLRSAPQYIEAQRAKDTIFTVAPRETPGFDFTYSRAVRSDNQVLGVIVVAVDLMKYERAWAGLQDAVLVTDSEGTVLLATEPRWRGLPLARALEARDAPSAIRRALQGAADWAQEPPDAYLSGEAVMKTETRVAFRGWRIITYTAYDSVRERVNGVIALEIMGFAILLAVTFYMLSRRAWSRSVTYQRESAELRLLNARLQREIAEREKVQKNLAVAELTLAQSSKLAALGEMSAAVSHELNQPLAAMKTYLAGARLLLQRKRPEEALSSFQRIDDLIDRMGAITRQLKSYARKGGEAFEPVDLRNSVSNALAMMEPQLKARTVRITRTLPRTPVMVMADRIRLEQVIINLLRNALDATKETRQPQIDLLLSAGETAILNVRDNGHGIKELENVFEPFYTTKKPGEGVGLGLAISSGIVTDLGGRLTARNADGGGAVFEMQLPILTGEARAAE
ncbi:MULTISPECIES: ATP-binding protein [Gemmobacter]|uniref:C4-dicarboxylate transport sensor protein DctB n=2 Tax=Gemmobacter TaxID=204456 RepID=A0A2T6B6Z5_9RHOB|nr:MULTISPECIES: ATP-binding protein [Gemmobacter]PTX51837.1 two-component system C4-dicarboxylate transport sensor histidine kinase DctB [Gemmobacter caeni]TWJ03965.1 two-component system C4-dicarboxylate transport sensor histidine kinase DctB [Gemmobacter caeni]GHC11266.1 two-component sensor histidine kinase [Gemmobacter nanjingensis]